MTLSARRVIRSDKVRLGMGRRLRGFKAWPKISPTTWLCVADEPANKSSPTTWLCVADEPANKSLLVEAEGFRIVKVVELNSAQCLEASNSF